MQLPPKNGVLSVGTYRTRSLLVVCDVPPYKVRGKTKMWSPPTQKPPPDLNHAVFFQCLHQITVDYYYYLIRCAHQYPSAVPN